MNTDNLSVFTPLIPTPLATTRETRKGAVAPLTRGEDRGKTFIYCLSVVNYTQSLIRTRALLQRKPLYFYTAVCIKRGSS